MGICDKTKCTGCGACSDSCAIKCITMDYDSNGFIYPSVNEQACVNCGMCRRVCPQLNQPDDNDMRNVIQFAYQASSNDENVLLHSTSGGIFSELARIIIQDGGVVFGAYFDINDMSVRHTYIDNFKDIDKLTGSKYIGSNLHNCFSQAKEFIKQGKKVLFSGTPCQIDGLRSYLGENHDTLYTVDFVCFGVGSRKILELFVKDTEKKHNGRVVDLKFRDKTNGYVNRSFSLTLKIKNDEKRFIEPFLENPFARLFGDGKINRLSCYSCNYASVERVSDITLADCMKDIDVPRQRMGCSLLMINTDKGKELFYRIIDKVSYREISIEQAKQMQARLSGPTVKPKCRQALIEDLKKSSFEIIMNKYYDPKPSKIYGVLNKIKRIVRSIIK